MKTTAKLISFGKLGEKMDKEIKEYQETHEKLVAAMQNALGLDPEEIEALKKVGDFDALQKMVDDAISKVVE